MDMQEPEEQRLEDEPMELAEDVSTPSDQPVLSDADASESDQEPAPVPPSEEEAEETPVAAELEEESVPETALDTIVETASVEAGFDEESATEESIEDVEIDAVEKAPEPEQDDDPSDWFVIHCYSGYENKVRHNLEQRIETMGMKDMIFDVVVPTQEEIEVRDGKRRTVERHIFPGYVLVNLILTEESWYVVRNTPGVTGFVGM